MNAITIEVDENLSKVSDGRLMLLWHVAQANPVPLGDKSAGHLVQNIGREIIRRWLGSVPPALSHHQGHHYYWTCLTKFAKYEPGGQTGTPEWDNGVWAAREPEDGGR
ncbi:MAG: hypothetical protein ACRDP6_37245 [Actinoallomurus sp.]